MDWGQGTYELTAAALAPVSEVVADAARIERGERVVDVACGTGNAALAAAARGARVSGLDAAERLIGVARERARTAGVEAEWTVGDATALPFADGAFDAAVSVFGVIFASDPGRAAAELERVVRPGGRIVVTSWFDRGPLAEVMHASMAAIRAAQHDPPPAADHFDWADRAAVAELFGGSELTTEERELEFRAASPAAWVQEQFEHHPAWRGAAALLEPEARAALEDDLVAILSRASTDRGAMRVKGPYLVLRAERRAT